MKGVGITEKKKPVGLPELVQQPDPLRRKIQEQGIPAVDDRLFGDLGEPAELAHAIR